MNDLEVVAQLCQKPKGLRDTVVGVCGVCVGQKERGVGWIGWGAYHGTLFDTGNISPNM